MNVNIKQKKKLKHRQKEYKKSSIKSRKEDIVRKEKLFNLVYY